MKTSEIRADFKIKSIEFKKKVIENINTPLDLETIYKSHSTLFDRLKSEGKNNNEIQKFIDDIADEVNEYFKNQKL